MRHLVLAVASLIVVVSNAYGAINLELRPSMAVVAPGQSVALGLYAVSDSAINQSLGSFQAVLAWTPSFLHLRGATAPPGSPLLALGFFHDAYGLNESMPPADGSGLLIGLGPLGGSLAATQGGLLLGTLNFTALAPTLPTTSVIIADSGGTPPVKTLVLDGDRPNVDVTGALSGATVRIVPAPSSAVLLAAGLVFARQRRACLKSSPGTEPGTSRPSPPV